MTFTVHTTLLVTWATQLRREFSAAINRASVKIDSNSHHLRHMRRSSNPAPIWVTPYSSAGQTPFTQMTVLPGNWTPCYVCRQAGENITHKGHWGASLGLEVRWPQSCWASLYTPYEWCMAGWILVWCGGKETEWETAAVEANEHWSRAIQLHWPQLVPSSWCPQERRKWP